MSICTDINTWSQYRWKYMSPLAALSNITITVLGSAVILLNIFCRSACEMCCNARLQQGSKVSIYGRKQKFSWQGRSEGQHKNKKQRWWVWKSKEAFFSCWCWFVLTPQNKPIQKTTQGLVDHYCHIELMDRSFDYSRANKGTHCGVPWRSGV